MMSPSNDLHHTNPALQLGLLLNKLRICGFKKKSVSIATTLISGHPTIGKYVVRLPVISLAVEYLILVPLKYTDMDFK